VDERFPTGLIVGRFDPPHLGHSYLVEEASARCEQLVVYVNSRHTDAAPGALRAAWLADLHPRARVIEVGHDLATDWHDEELWGRWIALFLARWPHSDGPHAVFSSDAYVAELARRLGAACIVVDASRRTVPISATMVRADPARHLDRLAAPVAEWVRAHWL
jgi:cytidyltransferase-like protein